MNKKHFLLVGVLTLSTFGFAQQNTPWHYPTQSNAVQAGFIGIGTKTTTTTTNTPLPNFNLHLHGTANYTESGNSSSINPLDPTGPLIPSATMNKSTTNYGITTRIGLTNTSTGRGDLDGTVLMASERDFYLMNRAQGDMRLETDHDMSFTTQELEFQLSHTTDRAWFGNPGIVPSTGADFAKFNISSVGGDNGFYMRINNAFKYGMSIKMAGNDADAIRVLNNASVKSFKVTGGGEVFARKYTTTLNNIPDYVFAPEYNLMPLSELRTYIQTERHLPNIPSAKVMEAAPVDLGEMNRLLLEKVEELTLYVLELEERLNKLEK